MTRELKEIAQSFVAARRQARALSAFPGAPPHDLATAYRVQDAAIALWPDTVAGWKIGRVPAPLAVKLGVDRVAGPIFLEQIRRAEAGAETPMPVYDGGFGAMEVEYIFRIGAHAPAEKTAWTREEAEALVAALHVGIETAGSPLASINDLGPIVSVCDFGNNHGLILGPEISNWRAKLEAGLHGEAYIDGERVGVGSASSEPGGPLDALAFLAAHLAQRGMPLKAGDLVSSGAVTGVHRVRIGESGRARFEASLDLYCSAVKAKALPGGSR